MAGYVGRALQALKENGNMLYYGGAVASLIAAVPFARRYAHVFQDLPWQELTAFVKYPWTAIGAGELGQVLHSYSQEGLQAAELHWLEHVGRAVRPANLAAFPVAAATDDSALYSLILTGASTVIGHGLECVGSAIRSRPIRTKQQLEKYLGSLDRRIEKLSNRIYRNAAQNAADDGYRIEFVRDGVVVDCRNPGGRRLLRLDVDPCTNIITNIDDLYAFLDKRGERQKEARDDMISEKEFLEVHENRSRVLSSGYKPGHH